MVHLLFRFHDLSISVGKYYRTGMGQGTMDFYIMLSTVHITQGLGMGTGPMGCIPIHHRDWYRVLS